MVESKSAAIEVRSMNARTHTRTQQQQNKSLFKNEV